MVERSWQRWQDWAALVIGVLTALAPLVTTTDAAAAWTMVVLGVVLAATSLWSLAAPGSVSSEYVHAALGVLLFIAPWVMGYTALAGASWTSWVAGVLTVVVAATAIPAANAAHHGAVGAH